MSPTATTTSPEHGESPKDVVEDEEDDYMTMAVPEPQPSTKVETSHQRRLRQQREKELRGRQKSKAELAAEAEKAREAALATSIQEADSKSKGAKMMAKLGYRPGETLGAPGNVHARLEPIGVEVKEGREGVGELSERKRKFREEVEREGQAEKKRKEDEGGFRDRVARERSEKRAEGQWWGAMKVLEGLHEDDGGLEVPESSDGKGHKRVGSLNVRARDIPLLYRPLVVDRRHRENESRRRHDMIQSLSRNRTYDDAGEDAYDKQALGKFIDDEEEEIEEDEDLQLYTQLPAPERLEKLVRELREKWLYCYWCKYRYGSEEELQSECPGETEDEHGLTNNTPGAVVTNAPSEIAQYRPLHDLQPLPSMPNISIPGLSANQSSSAPVHPHLNSQQPSTHNPPINADEKEKTDPAPSKSDEVAIDKMDPAIVELAKAKKENSSQESNSDTKDAPQNPDNGEHAKNDSDSDSDSDSDDDELDSVMDEDDTAVKGRHLLDELTELEDATMYYERAMLWRNVSLDRLSAARKKMIFWKLKYEGFYPAGWTGDREILWMDETTNQPYTQYGAYKRKEAERRAVKRAARMAERASNRALKARIELRETRIAELGPDLAVLEEAALRGTGMKFNLGAPGDGSNPVVRTGGYRVTKSAEANTRVAHGARLRLKGKRIS